MTPSIRNGEVVLVDRLVIDMKELSRDRLLHSGRMEIKKSIFISEE